MGDIDLRISRSYQIHGNTRDFPMFVRRRTIPLARVKPLAGLVRWLFLTISHQPNAEARQAYEKHAKREQATQRRMGVLAFSKASKKGTTCLSKTSERYIFKRNKYSKKFDWDSGHQNWQCWEMLGNQWSASWRVLPIDYPRNFVSSPQILEGPRQKPEKTAPSISMHHRSPPFRWKGPASAGGGRRSQFVLRPGLRRKHMPKGEVASPQNSGDIFGNRTLSPMFINVLSAQCFGPSSCPFIHIYIYMIIPRPSKQLCIGSFIPSSKSVPKVLWKKVGGSRCPLGFV